MTRPTPLGRLDIFEGVHIGDGVDVKQWPGGEFYGHVVALTVQLARGEDVQAFADVRRDPGSTDSHVVPQIPIWCCEIVNRNAMNLPAYGGDT